MKKICKMVIGVLAVVLMAGQVFSAEQLSPPEIRQIESKIRQDFQLQTAYVNSSLIGIGNDLDNFLFGPQTTANLAEFFNKRIKPGNISDQETLWLHFKEEVLSKEKFDQFVDSLIEIHFRVFDKARREVNRDLTTFGLEGVKEINYEDIKRKLKQDVSKIWDTEAAKMREILDPTSQQVYDANWYKKAGKYVEGSYLAADIAAFLWNPIVGAVGLAIFGGWTIYKYAVAEANAEESMETAQQQFMRKMTERLQSLSEQTKKEFKKASDKAEKTLFDAIRQMVVDAYPQLSKENLQ